MTRLSNAGIVKSNSFLCELSTLQEVVADRFSTLVAQRV